MGDKLKYLRGPVLSPARAEWTERAPALRRDSRDDNRERLAKESVRRARAKGTRAERCRTYRGQLISTGGTHPRSRWWRGGKGEEALSYVIFTPLASSSTSRYLFPLMPLPTPSYDLPVLPHAPGVCIPIYHPTLPRGSRSSHLPPVLSISAPSFPRRSYGLRERVYRLVRPPARPLFTPAITIVDRCDVGYTPRR